jgi:PTH2 family peptidyl-tRNA hydrolase
VKEDAFEYKQCIVLRIDLGMSTGKLISQACHAAVESSELAKKLKHKAWRAWRDEGAKKVVLQADSFEDLEELADKADDLDIVNVLIQDRGLTEVPPGTLTALGLGPDNSEKMDKVTGSLKLWK